MPRTSKDYLRRDWKMHKPTEAGKKENYIPSHLRPGFDEVEIEKLPYSPDKHTDREETS